ncbi:MAG: DNA polymerase I, partial [Clostridiales bacterium]|nr:DNA polymerase I [Clostridiales bacterium]
MNMLFKLVEDYSPGYISVAFDRKGPTFRHEAYADYKGTRQKTPEDLSVQFSILKDLLDAMGISIYEIDGYEADDILGTFAKLSSENQLECLLVTGDRDALQLVDENVNVLITRRGSSDVHRFDIKEVEKEYGILPSQVVDLKALMGDSSDNIPGVPRVGEKTGIRLLKSYKTLEGIYENIDSMKKSLVRENLIKYKAQAIMSRELAAINKDVPIDIDIEQCEYKIPKSEELRDMLIDLEFYSILERLDFDIEMPKVEMRKKDIIVVEDSKDLKALLGLAKTKDSMGILFSNEGLSLAFEKDVAYMINFSTNLIDKGVDIQDVLKMLKPIFESKVLKKMVHGGKDIIILLHGYDIRLEKLAFDTSIAGYLIDPTKEGYDLPRLMFEYASIDIDSADAADILLLAEKMEEILKETNMLNLYREIEHPLIYVLAHMELKGFRVDRDILLELGADFKDKIDSLADEIYTLVGGEKFNLNSPKQLGTILFDKLKLPVIKRTKTGYSTNIDVLEQLRAHHPIAQLVIDYRQVMKLQSTYIDGLLEEVDKHDGRIHSSFNQTVTATGRISSTEPNLQNIPIRTDMGRQIRKVFVASDDNHILVDADYSQIELRVLAHMSEDPTFIDAFLRGEDIHTRTAAQIFDIPADEVTDRQRNDAKAVNFGIVYGISDYGLARNINVSRNKAKSYIDNYFARYPKVLEYMNNTIESAREDGYVTTLLGRRRYLPELNSRNYNIRSFGERVAMNMPIQGTAADIIKMAMNNVYYALKEAGLKSKLILQVHDELIVDTYIPELDEVKKIVKRQMENAIELKVPLIVDIGIGYNWFDAN